MITKRRKGEHARGIGPGGPSFAAEELNNPGVQPRRPSLAKEGLNDKEAPVDSDACALIAVVTVLEPSGWLLGDHHRAIDPLFGADAAEEGKARDGTNGRRRENQFPLIDERTKRSQQQAQYFTRRFGPSCTIFEVFLNLHL